MTPNNITAWLEGTANSVRNGMQSATDSQELAGKAQAIVITAADFPRDPHQMTGAAPGSFYVVRNTAGLVPPSAGSGMEGGMGTALEFAVKVLGVRHIILLAHPECAFIRCLLEEDAKGTATLAMGQFLPGWAALVSSALGRALRATVPAEDRARLCAEELIRISIENLMTYPWVLDGAFDGSIALHGWYADYRKGVLNCFDPDSDSFQPVGD
jgi:carbonic anhydrase